MRIIDADELKEFFKWSEKCRLSLNEILGFIDNVPVISCKTCKYYHPYCYTTRGVTTPRGDGYCVIARMTPEGMTTINCNDYFGCSDYNAIISKEVNNE